MPSSLIVPFIIIQAATVAAIVMFLRMLLHKQLEIGMKRIKKMDKENLDKEVVLNEKIKKVDFEYNKRIEEAEKQADIIMDMAKEDAKNIKNTERDKAKEEAKKIIAGALDERDRVTNQTKAKILSSAVDFSVKILKRILSEEILEEIRDKSLKETVNKISSSEKIAGILKKDSKIEITISETTSDKNKEYIKRWKLPLKFTKTEKEEFQPLN